MARFGVSESVVCRLYQRYHQTGEVMELHGRGPKRATSRADDHYIINQSLRSRTVSAPKLRQRLRNVLQVKVSVQTLRNRLNAHGLKARRPVKANESTPHRRRVHGDVRTRDLPNAIFSNVTHMVEEALWYGQGSLKSEI